MRLGPGLLAGVWVGLFVCWGSGSPWVLAGDAAADPAPETRVAEAGESEAERQIRSEFEAAAGADGTEGMGWWDSYSAYVDRRVREVEKNATQYWGTHTVTIPNRIFSAKFIWNGKRVDSRYQRDGSLGPIIAPIVFDDPFGVPLFNTLWGQDFARVDLDVHGKGAGWLFTFFYGLTDPVDLYVTLPFQSAEVWLDVRFTPGTSQLLTELNQAIPAIPALTTLEDFYRLIEKLGRPRPNTHYKSKGWELADIHFGFLYNWLRNDIVSLLVKPRVVLPTARVASANNALIYALGPEIDAGRRAFGLGLANRVDVRAPKPFHWINWGMSVDYTYSFRTSRDSPRFHKPDPVYQQVLDAIGFKSEYFPDLSGLEEDYYVTYGHSLELVTTLMFQTDYFGVGAGYGFVWGQKPYVDTSSPAFLDLLEVLNAYPENELHSVSALANVPLFNFGIPLVFSFEARFPVAGVSSLYYEQDLKADVQLFIPF